jgi:hypothetical protein
MVNNSTNISKTNNYLSLLTLEHKNRLQHMTIEIEWRMMPVVQKYSPIIHSSVETLWLIATIENIFVHTNFITNVYQIDQ